MKTIPPELEMLARAGYHFREGLTDKIRFAKIGGRLSFPPHWLFYDGIYVLGPEENRTLLVAHDQFHMLETLEFSQTETPGVIQVITQPVHMPVEKPSVAYFIHMSNETTPKDAMWSEFDLRTYNKLRTDNYR